MINPEIILKNKTYAFDNIGNQIEVITDIPVPIIRMENIYANEFYKGSQAGFRPTLRLVISALNYGNENELTYNNIQYSIIRVDNINQDELALICEVKIG